MTPDPAPEPEPMEAKLPMYRSPDCHHPACTIYASLINEMPWDGICTCGYGQRVRRDTGRFDEVFSDERLLGDAERTAALAKLTGEREELLALLPDALGVAMDNADRIEQTGGVAGWSRAVCARLAAAIARGSHTESQETEP